MSIRSRDRLLKSGAMVVHWLMFALSLCTIAWITFPVTGG